MEASIDAIVESPVDEAVALVYAAQPPPPPEDQPSPTPDRPRSKRRALFLRLRSIPSSPSLRKLRPYRSSDRASMSCISLSTPIISYPQHRNGSDSDVSQHYSTAPTSVAASPGPTTPTTEVRPRLKPARDLRSVAVPCGVRPASAGSPAAGSSTTAVAEDAEDYFCDAQAEVEEEAPRRPNFNFWHDMPHELRFHILRHLTPRQLVRCSSVSRSWHDMCFDGQMWTRLDTTHYYRDIPADSLAKIITRAGPFVRDLNLRGCVQLREHWIRKEVAGACFNIECISIEGCMIGSKAIQRLMFTNSRLVHINLSGLQGANNLAMQNIAENCPNVEHLNVTWCTNVDTRGLRAVVESCVRLRDLRAGETGGWGDDDFALDLFERNTLERLALTNCESLTDEALTTLMVGRDGEIDALTDRVVCPPRRLKHVDLTRCRRITDAGLRSLAHNVPDLETLQLCKCSELTDASLAALLPTVPRLTHLDLEELEQLTNASLQALAAAPAAPTLRHLSVSYCEALGDPGLLAVVRRCPRLECLDADNTRASDLVLVEAAAAQLERNREAARAGGEPGVRVALRLVVYDCGNVTWTGVREVLSRNAEMAPGGRASRPSATGAQGDGSTAPEADDDGPNYPHGIVALKAFYTWQQTVNEHNRRTLAGAFSRANRLERKWAAFMMAGEEQAAAAGGAHGGGGILAAAAAGRRRGAGGGASERRSRPWLARRASGTPRCWPEGPPSGGAGRGARASPARGARASSCEVFVSSAFGQVVLAILWTAWSI